MSVPTFNPTHRAILACEFTTIGMQETADMLINDDGARIGDSPLCVAALKAMERAAKAAAARPAKTGRGIL